MKNILSKSLLVAGFVLASASFAKGTRFSHRSVLKAVAASTELAKFEEESFGYVSGLQVKEHEPQGSLQTFSLFVTVNVNTAEGEIACVAEGEISSVRDTKAPRGLFATKLGKPTFERPTCP